MQTWLLQLLQHRDLQRFAEGVLAYGGLHSACARELRELGCGVSSLYSPRHPVAFGPFQSPGEQSGSSRCIRPTAGARILR